MREVMARKDQQQDALRAQVQELKRRMAGLEELLVAHQVDGLGLGGI